MLIIVENKIFFIFKNIVLSIQERAFMSPFFN